MDLQVGLSEQLSFRLSIFQENHFHHLLTKNYNNKKIPILLFFIFLPPLFDFFLGINVYIIILFMILTYYLTLKKIQFKNKSALK
mgnify:CR=1 FL=1